MVPDPRGIPWLPIAATGLRRLALPAGALLAGGWVLGDALHLPLPTALAAAAMTGGWWWLSRPRRPVSPKLPTSLEGWYSRCDALLLQFDKLAVAGGLTGEARALAQEKRIQQLELLRQRQQRTNLELGVVGLTPPPASMQPALLAALRGALPLTLHWGHPLPSTSPDWQWPQALEQCDLLLYGLTPPLRGADLRWLGSLPQQQAVWLLVDAQPSAAQSLQDLELELRSQLPEPLGERLLFWQGEAEGLGQATAPLQPVLHGGGRQRLIDTDRRCLASLHDAWQTELEALRRQALRPLLQRTQWTVAGAVLIAPLPSLDLLVLAAANGLMLREMARLWNCPWDADQLRDAAMELAKAALALGVAEWSSQGLMALMRLEASTWLVSGALQALSAAYLTRVVAHAMADVLALSSGVPQADLQQLRLQAPLLVAKAAAAEQLDWPAFLRQAKDWVLSGPGSRGNSPGLDQRQLPA
ncbi:YcjF family protein [Synechococcus sp. CS-602]|nr:MULTISPECIES: YcjF family protein [unclassified Synechococcus]MCT0201127.1 YcjF family protein [Synechococcus sp. CS-603]MCT0204620.1 YcjF family protein [Synechococcus sp. CS-602]MCT0245900.1 YcjF family protein [Synechococcus sp. CS-601]TWB88301.1 uncharacterized protein DUF697 [Synechococcus sp. Ace-Pa]